MMRKFFAIAGACLLVTTGCSASLDSSLLRIDGSVSVPPFARSERQAVVYPAATGKDGACR